jgi:hypothetical protein
VKKTFLKLFAANVFGKYIPASSIAIVIATMLHSLTTKKDATLSVVEVSDTTMLP